MTGRYAAISLCLQKQVTGSVTLTFARIEEMLGHPLPPSARKHGAWWSNSRSKGRHNESWLSVGWETTNCDMKEQSITFLRSAPAVGSSRLGQRTRPPRADHRPAFDAATLGDTDLAANCAVSIEFKWKRLGAVWPSPPRGS